MVNPRIYVVIALLLVFGLARRLWIERTSRLQRQRVGQTFPAAMLNGRDRTWVVFTTPMCASCGPAIEHLRKIDPHAGVVVLDATQHNDLATRFEVRTAPTALLAGRDGTLLSRRAGAAAIRDLAMVS